MDGAEPIVGDVEKRIGVAGDDRRLGAGIADQLNAGRKIAQVLGIANIAMEERNAVAFEHGDISLAATTNEIVHDGHLVSFFAEMERDVRSDEAAAAGHQNVQGKILLQGFREATMCPGVHPQTEIAIGQVREGNKIHRQQIEASLGKIDLGRH